MATRIDIEITSDRGDGTLTWRAAGAKQPKGIVAAALLPAGTNIGDVLRAEAEFSVDGPELISISRPKAARGDSFERLELLGSGRSSEGVTTQLAKKPRRGRDGRDRRRGADRGGRNAGRGDRGGRSERGPRQTLRPGRAHREAWIASLPEGRRPIAEQLMHEGRDGVAAALERQNNIALSEGREAIDVGPTMRIVDELAPALNTAEWSDKVDAAIAGVDTADLRELRKVFSDAKPHVSDDSATILRTKLVARVDRDQAAWSREIREAIKEGRVARALHRSGRPPKAGLPMADDLVGDLCEAATAALDPDEETDRWVTVIEALAASPVRRLVRPEAAPSEQSDDLLDTVDRIGYLVPGVADVLGIEAEPPKPRNRRNKG